MPRLLRLRVGALDIRVAAAFVAVALAAVIAAIFFSGLMISTALDRVLAQQQGELSTAAAQTAATAYSDPSWRTTELQPLTDLVASDGAAAQIRDRAGRVVYTSPGFYRFTKAQELTKPILSHNKRIGQIAVRCGPASLAAAISHLKAERWRARLTTAGSAAVFALAVSLVVTRVITGPLEALLSATRARAAGARSIRIRNIRSVGVLRELLEGFNASADRLDRLERLRRDLVADVAHELRTPIAVLQAGHEAMLDGVAQPTPENLVSMRDEVLRLARMVEDLQRLSAAESGAMQLRLVPQDLAATAEAAAASLIDGFAAAGVLLERRLTSVEVVCDQDRMREVITNLLTNALKFTLAGGYVCLEVCPEGRDGAAVRVRDTGIGIPPDELPRVTERFFRGQCSASMAAGSGIGLTIVAELVRAHRGELAITSQPGQGTQVTITLPRHRTDRRHVHGRAVVAQACQ